MRDDEAIGGDDADVTEGDAAALIGERPAMSSIGEPCPPVTPLRRARAIAWMLAGTALAIVIALAAIGRMQPPWTLERVVLARANDVRASSERETSERETSERDTDVRAASERRSGGIPERVDAALARDDVSEQLKLALVDELARDPGDAATDTLLRASSNPSLLISMAAVKGLTGRPCERLEPALTALLVDDQWQRRAWAAKVLGESGCARMGAALSERWRSESDARVREQIADAMSALRATATR